MRVELTSSVALNFQSFQICKPVESGAWACVYPQQPARCCWPAPPAAITSSTIWSEPPPAPFAFARAARDCSLAHAASCTRTNSTHRVGLNKVILVLVYTPYYSDCTRAICASTVRVYSYVRVYVRVWFTQDSWDGSARQRPDSSGIGACDSWHALQMLTRASTVLYSIDVYINLYTDYVLSDDSDDYEQWAILIIYRSTLAHVWMLHAMQSGNASIKTITN